MEPLVFSPIYKERVWGGRDLESKLGRSDLPDNKVIGESWEIVDRDDDRSIVRSGCNTSKSIRAVIEEHPEEVMGKGWSKEKKFPILVKWLDCQERLSLQVHPPADIAPELRGEPKTENWYIVGAEPHAALMAGLKKGVGKEQFEKALEEGTAEPLCHRMPVAIGESIFIPSGRLHAIDGGNLILEIQQNSDTTYRVYDWGRVGLDGKPRELHINESIRSIDFDDFEPETIHPKEGEQLLADSDVFRLRKLDLKPGQTLTLEAGEPQIISVVNGELTCSLCSQVFERGDNILIPAVSSPTLTAQESVKVLITDHFNK